jgi:hypothetical protein
VGQDTKARVDYLIESFIVYLPVSKGLIMAYLVDGSVRTRSERTNIRYVWIASGNPFMLAVPHYCDVAWRLS